jgi:hypothetical protein
MTTRAGGAWATMKEAPRRFQRCQCGWTNTKDIGIPTTAAGPRAPDQGKGKSVVREPTWSSGSAQDGATGAGATLRRWQ